MPWLEPVSTAFSAAKLAHDVAKSSTTIRKHAKRIIYRLKHGTAVVPLFGAGGVGKSTAAKIIAGGKPLDIVAPYDESMLVEEQSLIGDIPGRLLAAPGQEARVARHWTKLLETIHDGTAFGVMNVVA